MEKKLFILAISAILILASLSSEKVFALIKTGDPVNDTTWVRSVTGTWQGKLGDKHYWYRIDKDSKLLWSEDGNKWDVVPNEMWADKGGQWLKIENHRVVWTHDSGKNWTEAPEWKWESPDGKSYKFDMNWNLWVKR